MNQRVHGLEPRSRILTLMALVLSAYLVLVVRLVYWQGWQEVHGGQLDQLRLPGIGKIAETQRAYVDGGVTGTSLAANLLGFANDEGTGNYGIEGYYNKALAGQPGFEATVRDLANQPIVLSDRQRR